jgi:uncharacterized protein YndB with AHSA1/START domain
MQEVKTKKKEKFTLEFEIKSSPKILFSYLSTASGLEGWFADKVTMNNGDFVFHWGDSEQKAKVVTKKDGQLIRFHWINDDKKDDTYFQFEVMQDDLTGDVALIVTDFTTAEEKEEDTLLWNSEVHELMHMIGS